MPSWITVKPLQIVLRWQLLCTIMVSIAVVLLMDLESALSALLGGMVSVVSSAAFAVIVSRHQGYTAGGTIRTALRAEAVKILLTVLLLWLVFIGTFIVTVILNSLALLVSDSKKNK